MFTTSKVPEVVPTQISPSTIIIDAMISFSGKQNLIVTIIAKVKNWNNKEKSVPFEGAKT